VEVHGKPYAADTGFMVFNDRTYPNFVRMLKLLGVSSRESDMSFSVRCDRTGLEYQGGTALGLFAQRRDLFRPSFYRMLRDILRFNREAPGLLDRDDDASTLDGYLEDNRYSAEFVEHYLVPMGAAIWSTPPGAFRQFPARYTVGFFRNHGLLQLRDRPQWRTIVGGAVKYVEALLRPLANRVRLNCPVERVQRQQDHVVVTPKGGESEVFDCVVLAAHADQSLGMLVDPSPAEYEILGAIPYQANEIVLHTDTRLLPKTRRAWASRNYHLSNAEQPTVTLT
jgi:predicted NAD/FAD-binding protein